MSWEFSNSDKATVFDLMFLIFSEMSESVLV